MKRDKHIPKITVNNLFLKYAYLRHIIGKHYHRWNLSAPFKFLLFNNLLINCDANL